MFSNITDVIQFILDEQRIQAGLKKEKIIYVEKMKDSDSDDIVTFRVVHECAWSASSRDETIITLSDILVFLANKAFTK